MIREIEETGSIDKNEMTFAIELARGTSVAQAAKVVGISEPTGYRWSRKPEVRHCVEQIRSEVLQAAASQIIGLASKAVETLDRLLSSETEQICLSAARTILDGTCKLRQLADLEKELEDIQDVVMKLQSQNCRRGA